MVGALAQPAEERGVPPGVEGLRRTLAIAEAPPVELDVGQVEPVERDRGCARTEAVDQPCGQGGLAGTGCADDPEEAPLPRPGREPVGEGDELGTVGRDAHLFHGGYAESQVSNASNA